MRKLLAYILTVTVFFCGCSNSDQQSEISENPAETPMKKPEISEPAEKKYTDEIIRIIIPAVKKMGMTPSDEHIDAWEKYMQNKYDVRFELIYTDYISGYRVNNTGNANGIVVEDIKKAAEQGGFIYLTNSSDIMKLIDADLIMSVNESIDDIPEYTKYPSYLFENSTTSDSKRWALPLYDTSDPIILGRIYRKDWLTTAGMDVPDTPEKLYDYAMYVANEDPDGDGKRNSYIARYEMASFTRSFSDIFRAFGCYTYSDITSITWNPTLQKYELMAQNDKYIEILSFIKTLKDEGCLYKVGMNNPTGYSYEDTDSYKIASARSLTTFNIADSEICLDLNDGSVEQMFTTFFRQGFVVLKGTENISEKMNTIINLLRDNKKARLDFAVGMKDMDYIENSDHYLAGINEEFGNKRARIGVYPGFSWIDDSKVLHYDYYSNSLDDLKLIVSSRRMYDEAISGKIPADMFYEQPIDISSSEISQLNAKCLMEVHELYDLIFIHNEDIETAVNAFIESLKLQGVIDDLEEINSNLMN